jgi:polar amino acid transport system permease protein
VNRSRAAVTARAAPAGEAPLNYVFQFGVVWENLPRLMTGAWLTLVLSVTSAAAGLALAAVCAFMLNNAPAPVRALVRSYVEVFRNTPFLVQLFVLYFSLPALGIRMDPNQAAFVGMTLNFGAYATEIIRAGLGAVSAGQIEAGRALGLKRLQIFRLVLMPQALRIVYPALTSQFVLLMLGSSVVAAISAEDLTAFTNSLQSTTFRSFEFYFVATAIYFTMALGFKVLFAAVHWWLFLRGTRAESMA